MIAIVDYGMGNLRSVEKAFEFAGGKVCITQSSAKIESAKALIVPGVGAFYDAMKNLQKRRLINPILKSINKGKPFFGICLGMQILFSKSEEGIGCKGLDVLRGKVIRFQLSSKYKVPHMGWNTIVPANKNWNKVPLLNDISRNSYVYFVHSYYPDPKDKQIVIAKTTYEIEFASAIMSNNIYATQFHPEKSQQIGSKIIKNFIALVKKS